MKSLVLFGMFIAAGVEALPNTYTTSTGAVFTQVQGPGKFGTAWKDPGGAIWSRYVGEFSNDSLAPEQNGIIVKSEAAKTCTKIGGKLPTIDDYQRLISFFDRLPENQFGHRYLTDTGRTDLYAVFPDMKNKSDFWTSTAAKLCPEYFAYMFNGNNGDAQDRSNCYGVFGYRPYDGAIRCISR